MPEHRIPMLALFGWLPKIRLHWKATQTMEGSDPQGSECVGISESEWYDGATSSREGWCTTYRLGLGTSFGPQNERQKSASKSGAVECGVCGTSFTRESDKKRHKCDRPRDNQP